MKVRALINILHVTLSISGDLFHQQIPRNLQFHDTPSIMEKNTLAPTTTTYLDTVESFLQQLLRITTIDGRVFLGTFAAVDKPLNIILINAEEHRISQGSGSQKTKLNEERRYVGQVLLPWKMIVKVEIYERHSAREKERRDRGDNVYM